MFGLGFYSDGWLGADSRLALWPARKGEGLVGTVSVRLEGPKEFTGSVPITVSWPGGRKSVDVAPGASIELVLPVCSTGQWLARITTTRPTVIGSRAVSVYAGRPVWRPDHAACKVQPADAGS